MKFERELSVKNMKRRPLRTAALVLLSGFLAFSVFGGTLMIRSLQNGLNSYEARLGADIVVVPKEARSHGTVESILLQGIPGYFYMDSSVLEKVRGYEGVEAASPQFYLSSTSSGCCSASVEIIGFDPETDFSIKPWISKSFSGEIGDGDLVVGSNITVPKNKTLKFYDVECKVCAKLSETGTGLDNAVYTNMNTIRKMMESSKTLGFDTFSDISASRAISSVMVKVAEGYDIKTVTGDINIHTRRVEADSAKSMVSGIASGLSSISHIARILLALIWVLGIAILMAAFAMIVNERVKEFAVLRTVGASKKMLSRQILTESAAVCGMGAIAGAAIAALLLIPFSGLLKRAFDMPYLLPSAGSILLIAIISIFATVLAGALISAVFARRVVKKDTGLLLREGA